MRPASRSLLATAIVAVLASAGGPDSARAQQGDPVPVAARSLVTVYRLKPEMAAEWIALQRNEVIPALKKAGFSSRTMLTTAVGNGSEYVALVPFPLWAARDGDGPFVRALGREGAAQLNAKIQRCILTQQSYLITRDDSLSIPGNDAMVWRTVVRRVAPGKLQEYRDFYRTEVLPLMKRAAAEGRLAGTAFAVRGVGASSGELTTVTMYARFADLDHGDPILASAGRETASRINAKSAQLAPVVQTIVRRKVAELSF